MPGLILEGGTFRPIFSCGVMDALLAHDLMCDYVIGVSAGITDGFSYVSRQSGRNLEIAQRYRNDKRYLSPGNYLKCRSIFGLDFVFDTIPNELLPFDWDTFRAYKGRILVGVTNAETGVCEYLDGRELDARCPSTSRPRASAARSTTTAVSRIPSPSAKPCPTAARKTSSS